MGREATGELSLHGGENFSGFCQKTFRKREYIRKILVTVLFYVCRPVIVRFKKSHVLAEEDSAREANCSSGLWVSASVREPRESWRVCEANFRASQSCFSGMFQSSEETKRESHLAQDPSHRGRTGRDGVKLSADSLSDGREERRLGGDSKYCRRLPSVAEEWRRSMRSEDLQLLSVLSTIRTFPPGANGSIAAQGVC